MQERKRGRGKAGNAPIFLLIPILIIGVVYTSCKKENLRYTVRFTVLNAVPDANAIDVVAGGDQLNISTAYGAPDYYVDVPAVTDSIKWRVSGQTNYDSVFVADLPNGADFTLLFYDSASKLGSFMIKDSWQQPASETKGYLRYFPLTMNANAIQITNDTGKVLISGRSFADFKSGSVGFTAIDTLNNTLKLVNNSVVLDSLPGVKILPGKSYTLYSVGVLNATGDKRPRLILQEHHD